MKKQQPKSQPIEKKIEEFDPYCPVCGGCGYIGCCGIKRFLEKHVRGKTNCTEEASFIADIISYCEDGDPSPIVSDKLKEKI